LGRSDLLRLLNLLAHLDHPVLWGQKALLVLWVLKVRSVLLDQEVLQHLNLHP
jgi:hypothetical protein